MKHPYLLTILFPCMLFLGLLGSIFTEDYVHSELENRYLTQLPSFTGKALLDGSYTEALEQYWNDQFPGRDTWITAKTLAEKSLFQKTVINDVYLGADDYFINRYPLKDIHPQQVQANCNYLNRFQQKYDATVILIPSASEILTDKLPPAAEQPDLSIFLQDVKTTLSGDEILTLHRDEPIYYKTDHHWTLLGAYHVYSNLVQNPVPYDSVTVSTNFQGTAGRKIGFSNTLDTIQRQKSTSAFQVIYDDNPDTLTENLYEPKYLKTTDQYSYFLDGNHGITQIDNLSIAGHHRQYSQTKEAALSDFTSEKNIREGHSILIVKDSFANTLATLLCENYETVYLIDLRRYNGSIEAFIREHGIEEVLFLYSKINFMQDKNLSRLLS